MLTEQDKKIIAHFYTAEWLNPEDIAEKLNLDETEVINYCLEIL